MSLLQQILKTQTLFQRKQHLNIFTLKSFSLVSLKDSGARASLWSQDESAMIPVPGEGCILGWGAEIWYAARPATLCGSHGVVKKQFKSPLLRKYQTRVWTFKTAFYPAFLFLLHLVCIRRCIRDTQLQSYFKCPKHWGIFWHPQSHQLTRIGRTLRCLGFDWLESLSWGIWSCEAFYSPPWRVINNVSLDKRASYCGHRDGNCSCSNRSTLKNWHIYVSVIRTC